MGWRGAALDRLSACPEIRPLAAIVYSVRAARGRSVPIPESRRRDRRDHHWRADVVGVRNTCRSRGPRVWNDRDGKYCPAFDDMLRDAGVTPVRLPPRSPNLNAHAERWVRSVKDECLSKLILFGEPALQTALRAYVEHLTLLQAGKF